MVDVGLTENIGDSGLKFEIWYRRWKKGKAGESFILTVRDSRAVMSHIKFMFSVCKYLQGSSPNFASIIKRIN